MQIGYLYSNFVVVILTDKTETLETASLKRTIAVETAEIGCLDRTGKWRLVV